MAKPPETGDEIAEAEEPADGEGRPQPADQPALAERQPQPSISQTSSVNENEHGSKEAEWRQGQNADSACKDGQCSPLETPDQDNPVCKPLHAHSHQAANQPDRSLSKKPPFVVLCGGQFGRGSVGLPLFAVDRRRGLPSPSDS